MEHKASFHTLDRTDGSVAPRSRKRLILFALGVAVLLLVATIYLSLPAVESSVAPGLTGGTTSDSARWAAMGDYYAAEAADVKRGAASNAARWNAMGEHYAAKALDVEQITAARWNAMGEYYAAKAFNVDANVARWEAMGDHYAAEAADVERGAAASVARWVAMGEYYSQ